MGARHVGYGAVPQHYATVGEALLWALARGLGVAFDSDTRSAWVKVYELLATTMHRRVKVRNRGVLRDRIEAPTKVTIAAEDATSNSAHLVLPRASNATRSP